MAKCLKDECRFTVYYAGEGQSNRDSDPSHLGAKKDIEAIKESQYFLLLYPVRILSSVLFEAGLALNHCDSSIYFVRDDEDLPYLMRRLPEVMSRVKTFTYQGGEDILSVLKLHRNRLFEEIANAPKAAVG